MLLALFMGFNLVIPVMRYISVNLIRFLIIVHQCTCVMSLTLVPWVSNSLWLQRAFLKASLNWLWIKPLLSFISGCHKMSLILLNWLYGIQAWHCNSKTVKNLSSRRKKQLHLWAVMNETAHFLFTYPSEVHVTADERSDWQTDRKSQALLTFFTAKFPSGDRNYMAFSVSNGQLKWATGSLIASTTHVKW